MAIGKMLVAFSILFFSPQAHAAILCTYAAYIPSSIKFFLNHSTMSDGFGFVPEAVFAGMNADPDATYVVQDGYYFGSTKLKEDRGAGVATLEFFDANGKALGYAREDVTACRTGICRRTTLSVGIGTTLSTVGLSHRPGMGVNYFTVNQSYERELPVVLWRSQFDEHLNRIVQQMTDPNSARMILAPNRLQNLYLRLFSDPFIQPYMGLINLVEDSSGRLIFSGRINQGVYDQVLMRAMNLGYYNIVPKVVIDSGVVFYGPIPSADLRRCL